MPEENQSPPETHNASEKSSGKDSSKSVTAWAQIVATAFIGIVGVYFTYTTNKQAEQNRMSSMATQLMSNREQSETSFRQNMFVPLITKILDDSMTLEKRFVIFKLFQNNFNDLFNSRSLFDVLADKAQDEIDHGDSAEGVYILNKLVSLARKTNQEQELLIGGKQLVKEGISQNDSITWSFNDKKEERDEREVITVNVDSVANDFVTIRLTINYDDEEIKLNNGKKFGVNYFDSPMTDNVLLPDGDRVAVTLEDIATDKDKRAPTAKIRIIHFPADFVTAGYRPSIQRVNELINQK